MHSLNHSKQNTDMYTITGASGYLGTALVEYLGAENCVCLGHSEKPVEQHRNNGSVWHIGDITDKDYTDRYIKGDVVIHCAAQKVIPIAEENPEFAIKNNVLGTLNVFQSAIKNSVKTVVLISTDKAYNPETIYGKTKEMGEWLCQYYNRKQQGTRFLWCRYGNVIGSAMSVFEIWDKNGKEGKTLLLTVPEMTRFFFTIHDAIRTVMTTIERNDTEHPYIPKMKSIAMGEACSVFCEHYGVGYEVIGNRGMEKLHEGMSDEYNSETCEHFTKEEFKELLQSINLLQ